MTIDHAAEAMLCATLDESGGLLAAFARLCSGASMGDVEGETYQAALERMMARHFGKQRIALHGIDADHEEP